MSQTELLDQFVLEARDCLERIGQRLLDVERAPQDTELLNDLFRAVHTLKGNCGLFEFKPLERVVHAGEDVLDRVRHGLLAYTSAIGDTLLEAMDFTVEMVDQIESAGRIEAAAEPRSLALAQALRRHLDAAPAAAAPGAVGAAAAASAVSPNGPAGAVEPAVPLPPVWLSRLPSAPRQAHPQATAVCYRPEPDCFFKGEDPWRLMRQLPGLLLLQTAPVQPWPDAAALDPYRCNLEFLALSSAPLAYVQEHFRYVPEQVELYAADDEPPAPSHEPPHTPGTGSATTGTQAATARTATGNATGDAMGSGLAAAISASTPRRDAARDTLRTRALQLWAEQRSLLLRGHLAAGTLVAVRRALAALLQAVGDERSLAARAELDALPADLGAAALAAWTHQQAPLAVGQQPDATGDVASVAAEGERGAVSAAAAAEAPRRSDDHHPAGGAHRVLKVGQEKVDRLMDLIGEMVVAKNALPYLAQRAETVFGQRELAREIKAQYAVINRIAEDMQHAIMQVRMLPVGTVFQRFGRLVRDISKKLGKDVQLVVEGEETEADKNVIEALADPLIHILRNSLDHGIEQPAQRLAAGKPAAGTIRVAARQESDRVVIEISDDGAGIDPRRVRAKAVERGLIPADKADTLSDAEAVQLIFLPGFSTATEISDLSGRGVGMDVVRTAVERINGQVELSSTAGRGTAIRLSLPLSMAVTNVMIIEAAGRRFGLPMDLIVETVRVHADDIHHFKQARTTVLRGRIVPLRALSDLLGLDEPPRLSDDGEHAVLVVRLGGDSVGLLIDQFHGATDIILKPLEGVLAGLTGFAGTALMGDGSVLMVLNPKELV